MQVFVSFSFAASVRNLEVNKEVMVPSRKAVIMHSFCKMEERRKNSLRSVNLSSGARKWK